MQSTETADDIRIRRQALLSTLRANAGVNADQEARDQGEARRLGMSPDGVRQAQRAGTPLPPRLRNLDITELPERAPRTSNWLSQPNNARVGHDDIDNMVDAEDVVRAQGSFAGQQLVAPPRRAPTFGNLLRGIGNAFMDAVGPEGTVVAGTKNLLGDQVLRATGLDRARDATGNLIFTQADRDAGETRFLEAQSNFERNRPDVGDGFGGAVYSGVESFARMAPALAASVALRNPTPSLVAAGTQTGGEAYGRYDARGATQNEALLGAGGEATVEVLTEIIPISKLLDMVGAKNFKTAIVDWAKSQFADQVGEQIATAAQDAIDTAIANPDKTWAEYWEERPDAAFQTAVATVVQGALSAGSIGGVNLVTNVARQRRQQTEQQQIAEQQAAFADNLNKVAEASKLRARSPASFEAFMEEATADGPVENVYIDAAVFNQSAQEAGIDLNELAQSMPELARQLEAASTTEGDLQIPVASFAAHVAGTDLGKALIDHIRVDPSAPSRAEVQTAGENAREQIRSEVERMLATAARDEGAAASAENVKQGLLAELNRAGRFTPQVNDAYASWVSAFYATRAEALGITPEEMAERYPLRVMSVAPASAGATLEQETQTEERRGFIGRVVDMLKGAPAQLTPEAQTETAAADTVQLIHFGRQTGLTETDPTLWGSSRATPAEERARAAEGSAPGRTYFYDAANFTPEPAVTGASPFAYETTIPAAALYDFDADPQNLREGRSPSEYETAIREAGFKGYRSNEVVNGAVAVFEPLALNQFGPVREWQQFHALKARMNKLQQEERRARSEAFYAANPGSEEIVSSRPAEEFRDQAMRELFGTGAALEEQLARYAMVEGAPKSVRVNGERLQLRPTPAARDAAFAYMASQGLQYEPPRQYAQVDLARAKRIADAFDQMQHAPDDPLVRASYRAMIEETLLQYQFVKATGLEISLMVEGMEDPYAASPRLATEDVRNNNHLWVYPTDFGFGGPNASDIDISGNPLLEWTDEYIGDKRLRANDVFRIVHDYFGHVKDGFGFRADGEENAWQSHAAMFTPLARRAMTTETRGQNSWVNFGPYGEKNRTASASETEYAPQKIGLLPEWVQEEGFLGGENSGLPMGETREPSVYNQETPVDTRGEAFKAWFGDSKAVDENGDPLVVYHGTGAEFDAFDTGKTGSNTGAASARGAIFFSESAETANDYAYLARSNQEVKAWDRVRALELSGRYEEAQALTASLEDETFDNPASPNVMPVYLSLQNPLEFDFEGASYNSDTTEVKLSALVQQARDEGRDGLILRNLDDAVMVNDPTTHFVVFAPTQIKSIFNRGTFDRNDARILYQSDAPTNPPFYSALKRAVEESKTAKAPATQWKATLAKTPGVKTEELEWTGLNEWLDIQEGSVERATIIDYLDAGGIQLEEVVLGEGSPELVRQLEERFDAERFEMAIESFEENGYREYRVEEGENENGETVWQVLHSEEEFDPESGDSYTSEEGAYEELTERQREEAEDYARVVVADAGYERDEYVEDMLRDQEGNAQYIDYKLPGADETYREFLLKLPVIRGERFKSSEGHFDDQDDVIAHARFTTREDAEGRRVLFLEEVQSTHHEMGRKQGYKGEVPQEEIDRLYAAVEAAQEARDVWVEANLDNIVAEVENAVELLRAEREAAEEGSARRRSIGETLSYMELRLEQSREVGFPFFRINDLLSLLRNASVRTLSGKMPDSATDLLSQESELLLRSREAQNAYNAATEGVEPAPWTKSWSQLVMKRMIRYAVDNGLDGVAWINGNQQNGGQTGEDGAWFYERNLVNEMNAVLKKLGSRVEKIDMRDGAAIRRFPDATPLSQEERSDFEARRSEMADAAGEGDLIRAERIRESLAGYADRISAETSARPDQATGIQNGFYLTDKIKEQAAQGFTLFQPKRGQIAFGQDLSLTPSVITLLRTADLSTFLHETGHFFLEVDAHIASQPDAPQQIKDDFQALLDWFGVKDIATWNAMTVDQKRDHHERFARGMEMYLLEGRAPTLGLSGLFRRFSAWMKAVYKNLTDLNVTLTDEVRGVMDRMVASSEAIAEAEAAFNLRPFANERPPFMSEEEWADYQSQFAPATAEGVEEVQSRAVRDMKWLSNAKSKALKRLQREANAQRRLVKAEVTEEVRNEPVYRAMRFLSHGVDAEGNPIENAGKLDLDTLVAEYGDAVEGQPAPAWTKLRRGGRYGLVGVGGIHPDLVAADFGFASGDAMIRAMVEAEDINQRIAGLTDSRMLERYGDLADARAIEDAANLAVSNDARIRVLNTEYAALAKATGQPRALAAAAREHAARVVNGMPLKTLKPYHFFNAAARAGRNAEKAIRAGDLAQAATHKRNQIMNLQAAREVIKAKDEVNKAAKLFTRIITAKDETIAKTREMALVNAARGILGRYGISRSKNDPMAELEKVKRYDPELFADMTVFLGLMPSRDTDYMTITYEDFVAMRDNVAMLWQLSRRSKQVIIDGQLMELSQVSDALRNTLVERGIPENRPGQSRAPTDMERAARRISGFRAALRRVESWVRAIDNGERGAFRRYIWQPVSEAADTYRAESARYLLRFADIVKPIEADLAKKTKIAAPELGYTFNNKAELLHAILHRGNGSNLSKLLLGRGWASKTADGSLDTTKWDAFEQRMWAEGTLTKEHYDFAKAVWNLLNDTKPAAQRAHHQMYGRYFAEVTADPFMTPWGEYAGGYVPATTDSFLVADAAIRGEELAFQESSSSMFPAASNGFTKSRTEDYTRQLALDVRLLPMHIDKVLRFSHLGPAVKDVNRILRQRGFNEALEAFDPTAQKDLLLPWLQRAANQTVSTPIAGEAGKGIDKFFRELRSRTGLQLMFANVSNVLQQTTGILSAATRVKKANLAQAMWQYTRSPTKTTEAVAQLSEFMANRTSSQMFETRQALEEMLLNPNKYERLRKFSERHGYFAQMFYQNIMDVVVWTASYNQQIENGRDEAEAIRIANSVIRETQNSMSPEDISRFETGTSFTRAFTQFYSHFNNQANLLGTEAIITQQSDLGLGKKVGRYSYLIVVGYMAQAAVADAIAQLFRGGWEDEEDDGYLDDVLAWFFSSQLKYGAAMVPIAGQAFNAALAMANDNPTDDRISVSPFVSIVEGGIRAPVEIGKSIFQGDEFTRRDIRDTATLLGMLTNLPLGWFGRPAGYLKDVADGKVEPTGPDDLARGLLTGTPSPESKK